MNGLVWLALTSLAKRKHPRGQSRTPVGLEVPDEVPVVIALMVMGLLAILGAFAIRRLTDFRTRQPDETKRSDVLYVGAIVRSPNLGAGDLGWGSRPHGAGLPIHALRGHMLIGGGTGEGKSTTIERIEFEAGARYAPQIVHFDCKGRRGGNARFLAILQEAGYDDRRMAFAPLEPYDGWRGDERAHVNRLLAIQDFSESQPYYTASTKDLLQQVVAESAPSCAQEFIDALERPRNALDPKVVAGTAARYRGFFHGMSGLLDGWWGFDDVDACYIELPGMERREDAISFGRYLLEDFMHYIAARKRPEREVLLVLDDFSAISRGDEAVNLLERSREFNCSVILTTQSHAGLGSSAERIIDACNGALIVHRMANPELVTGRAGTVWRQMESHTVPPKQGWLDVMFPPRGGAAKPTVTYRPEELPRIDPNEVRSLPRGEAFVIAGGRAQRIRVAPLPALDVQDGEELGIKTSRLMRANGNLNLRISAAEGLRKTREQERKRERRWEHVEATASPELDF